MNSIRPEGQTFLGLALKKVFATHGANGKYLVFTDGEPNDPGDIVYEAIKLFENTQLHLFAFGSAVNTDLLFAVGNNPKHTISYIEDIRSLAGYMVPIFIWAMTELKQVELSPVDEEIRKKFVQILKPQVRGSMTQYKQQHLTEMLSNYQTPYARDLVVDTIGLPAHGRIKHSFDPSNWHTFGKFYLPCILECHEYKYPGNSFDPSLKNYRTKEYNEIFEKIASIPSSIEFVAFMKPVEHQAAASVASSAVVQQSYQSADTYSYSSSDNDGCIEPDAKITMRDGTTKKMCDVRPGDLLETGSRIKWIIRISNLNHGNLIPLYNGLTGSHPVYHKGWTKAKYYPDAKITYTTGIVYDVILEDPKVSSMEVNGINAAVVGFPIPNMIHPYWGSSKVVEDVQSRYPDGGFVDIDAKQFGFTNGLVSSLFGSNK